MHAWVAIRFLLDIPIVLRFSFATQPNKNVDRYFMSTDRVYACKCVAFTYFHMLFEKCDIFICSFCVALSDFYRVSKRSKVQPTLMMMFYGFRICLRLGFSANIVGSLSPVNGWSHFRWHKIRLNVYVWAHNRKPADATMAKLFISRTCNMICFDSPFLQYTVFR